jgi:uncharacterized protein
MSYYLRHRPAWYQLIIFGALSTCALILLTIFSWVVMNKLGIEDSNFKSIGEKEALFMKIGVIFQFAILFLFPVSIFALLCSKNHFQFLGFKKPLLNQQWLLAPLILLVSFPVVALLGYINEFINPSYFARIDKLYEDQMQFAFGMLKTNEGYWQVLLATAVFAPIGEELFFRSVVQRIFIQLTKSPVWGILIAAIIFSAFHMHFAGFLPRLFLGILLGVIYWYSQSIWLSIIAHAFYNGLQVTVAYLMGSGADNVLNEKTITLMQWILPGLVSLALVSVLVYLFVKKIKNPYPIVFETHRQGRSEYENFFSND